MHERAASWRAAARGAPRSEEIVRRSEEIRGTLEISGDAGELRPRCGGSCGADAREMRRRCGGDATEMRGRCGGEQGRAHVHDALRKALHLLGLLAPDVRAVGRHTRLIEDLLQCESVGERGRSFKSVGEHGRAWESI